ncbi:hypothetical protein [uncultured Arcticibacterium sp.]|uniref:hypothetical protein n=1 Tax=uncultured Arcticibacterium sp. TaxID=2173042 RepID=UPI0030FB9A72
MERTKRDKRPKKKLNYTKMVRGNCVQQGCGSNEMQRLLRRIMEYSEVFAGLQTLQTARLLEQKL